MLEGNRGEFSGNWRVHLPSECQGTAYSAGKGQKREEEKGVKAQEKKSLRLAKAMYSVVSQSDSSKKDFDNEERPE